MAEPGVTLDELAAELGGTLSGGSLRVVDATHDSRDAGPGTLFVAVPGFRLDGHDFAAAAVEAGSPAVCVNRPLPLQAAQLVVADTTRALAPLAARVHGHPSRRLRLVGVTGTNGKTTVTHMIESIAAAAGMRTGLIGTIETRVGADPIPTLRTTPEATDFQRLLAVMADRETEVVASEVSSHALALGRVEATSFEVAAFTNLSQDHLDFHGDLASYFEAKAALFLPERCGTAVVWVDDPRGGELAERLTVPLVSVGWEGGRDVSARHARLGLDASSFLLVTPSGPVPVELRLGGRFNVANALLAAGCAWALGIDLRSTAAGLGALATVPGRWERISGDDPVAVLVDYAHTPEGIADVVGSARSLTSGSVIVVVGAGGDRDQGKRPLMGEAAAGADLVVVTSDNPRSEDPEAIIDQLMAGVVTTGRPVIREGDRRSAIRRALEAAAPGDVVLVLGKGHERGQERAGVVVPFDDRQVAREELGRMRGGPEPNGPVTAQGEGSA